MFSFFIVCKKNWNKNGIVQFKNKRIAILQKDLAQVEFIIAFDDLTAEGYELKAIDEGKTGDAQGLSGGVNSYYYFQRNNSLVFPNGKNQSLVFPDRNNESTTEISTRQYNKSPF